VTRKNNRGNENFKSINCPYLHRTQANFLDIVRSAFTSTASVNIVIATGVVLLILKLERIFTRSKHFDFSISLLIPQKSRTVISLSLSVFCFYEDVPKRSTKTHIVPLILPVTVRQSKVNLSFVSQLFLTQTQRSRVIDHSHF
jgi:hypothetical protein